MTRMNEVRFLPRLIRLRDAPSYVGMDRNRFNQEVRPQIPSVVIGIQGIAFDRLDLDRWVDDYMRRNGRPASPSEGESLWDVSKAQGFATGTGFGTSKNKSSDTRFARALAQAASKKPS